MRMTDVGRRQRGCPASCAVKTLTEVFQRWPMQQGSAMGDAKNDSEGKRRDTWQTQIIPNGRHKRVGMLSGDSSTYDSDLQLLGTRADFH